MRSRKMLGTEFSRRKKTSRIDAMDKKCMFDIEKMPQFDFDAQHKKVMPHVRIHATPQIVYK